MLNVCVVYRDVKKLSSVTLGANLSSLMAQRRLAQSGDALATSYERLASGQRINHASDDAAGLAVADSLRVKGRLYGAAIRNVNDGISLLNIIDGTLTQQSNILSRLGELAEQSANGSYSDSQRNSVDKEFQSLLKEFTRLAESTEFNGLRPLLGYRTGSLQDLLLQAGIDGGRNSQISVGREDTGRFSGRLSANGKWSRDSSGEYSFYSGDGEITTDDYSVLSDSFGTLNPSSTYANVSYFSGTDSNGRTRQFALAAAEYSDDGTFGSTYSGGDAVVDFVIYAQDLASGRWTPVGQLSGSQSGLAAGKYDFSVSYSRASDKFTSGYTGSGTLLDGSTANFSFDFSALKFDFNSTGSAIDFTSVSSQYSAKEALDTISSRLAEMAQIRGKFGAAQSRLNSALKLLSVSMEGVKSAEARIRDVDVADESSELTRRSVLQKVGAAVLAQANQQPQLALRLLKNE